MTTKRRIVPTLVVLSSLLAACSGDDESAAPTTTSAPTTTQPSECDVMVQLYEDAIDRWYAGSFTSPPDVDDLIEYELVPADKPPGEMVVIVVESDGAHARPGPAGD